VRALLAKAGIDSEMELERGYDHGVFVPLKVSFPDADIPIVQLSLQAGLDPSQHLAIGRALSVLREENILVIGSGLSFHNLAALGHPAANTPSLEFDRWLTHAVCDAPAAKRAELLSRWTEAPHARLCHPREEHLLPLMVAVGAAGDSRGRQTFSGKLLGKSLSGYQFD
jgi:aromatic ring-opening dioxygenase catalytic subunit (LigB family)